MAKKTETTKDKSKLTRGKNYFTLIGELKFGQTPFVIGAESKKSAWIYNSMSLGVKVNEGYIVYAETSQGFMGDNPSPVKVAKKGAQKGDAMIEIAWEDRLNVDSKTADSIADMSYVHIAIEHDANGKIYYQKFLTMYDAIPYLQEHLKEGMKVKVRGRLKPNYYNGKVTFKKEITGVSLAKPEDKPSASGVISILVTPDSINKTRVKESDELDIEARFVDYAKEYNGHTIKDNIAYPMTLVLPLCSGDPQKNTAAKYTVDKLKVAKGKVREIPVEVIFEEGNQTKQATLDDLDDESRSLVAMGIFTEEEALGKMVIKGNKLSRLILLRPFYETEEDEAKGKKFVLRFDDTKYTMDDLFLPEPIEQTNAEEVAGQSLEDAIAEEIAKSGVATSGANWLDEI